MLWALAVRRGPRRSRGRSRARRAPCLPGPRRSLARRRDPEGAAGADREGGGRVHFGSKASPRFWSVSRSVRSNPGRPLVKVLPLTVLGMGLLLWCAFREKTEVDERLEAVLSGQILDTAQESKAPLQLQKEN